MAFNPDPFTQVYQALWGLLESHAGVTGLVKIGNRVKYVTDSDRRPEMPQALTGDLPELRLVPVGGPIETAPTSTAGCGLVQRFEIQALTGDQRLQAAAFPLKWELLRTLAGARDGLGLAFVKKVRLGPSEERLTAASSTRPGTDRPDGGKGIKGWNTVVQVNVEMWFSTQDLV